MDEITTNHQILQKHFEGPEGQKLLRVLQLLVGTLLLGSLVAGVAFAVIVGLGPDLAAQPPASATSGQPEAAAQQVFPMLGITAAVVALGGLLFGTLMLRQSRDQNLNILAGEEELPNPQTLIQSTLMAWLIAAAMREGPLLLALLFAVVNRGNDRTICLGAALAILAWWCAHLPTRKNFSHTLGLD
jgi:hypothetical protein